LCTADKKKGQSKHTLCSGEWVEAELDGYKIMHWLPLNCIVLAYGGTYGELS